MSTQIYSRNYIQVYVAVVCYGYKSVLMVPLFCHMPRNNYYKQEGETL